MLRKRGCNTLHRPAIMAVLSRKAYWLHGNIETKACNRRCRFFAPRFGGCRRHCSFQVCSSLSVSPWVLSSSNSGNKSLFSSGRLFPVANTLFIQENERMEKMLAHSFGFFLSLALFTFSYSDILIGIEIWGQIIATRTTAKHYRFSAPLKQHTTIIFLMREKTERPHRNKNKQSTFLFQKRELASHGKRAREYTFMLVNAAILNNDGNKRICIWRFSRTSRIYLVTDELQGWIFASHYWLISLEWLLNSENWTLAVTIQNWIISGIVYFTVYLKPFEINYVILST